MSVLHPYYVITGICCTLTVVQDCTPLCVLTGLYCILTVVVQDCTALCVMTGLYCTLTVSHRNVLHSDCDNRAVLHSDCVVQDYDPHWLYDNRIVLHMYYTCVPGLYGNPCDDRIVLHSKINLQLPLNCKPRPCVIIRQWNQYSWLSMSSIIQRLWTLLVMLRQSGTKWLQFIAPRVQSEATITLTLGHLGEVVEIFKFVIFNLI